MAAEAFPLAWPVSWPRTPTVKRGPSRFGKNLGFCPANKILTTTVVVGDRRRRPRQTERADRLGPRTD
jgi:hypothetical protein